LIDHADLLMLGIIVLVLALVAALIVLMTLRRRSERAYVSQLREREERLKLALWATGEHYWDYDLVADKLRRSQPDDTVSDSGLPQLPQRVELAQVIHPDDLPLARERLRRYLEGETPMFRSEHRVLDVNGEWVWIRARGRVVARADDGSVLRVAGTALNITNDRHVERERRIASAVLRNMNEAVTVLDGDFRFVSVNPAFTRMTGYEDEQVSGRGADLLDSSQHDPAFYRHVRDIATRQGRFSGEMWQRRKDGEEFLCAIETSAVQEVEGEPPLYVAVLSDITQQKRAEQELRYLANFDTLTNLPNRTLLSERLSRAIVRARG
jgi:PAS domain S-box-containing protein